ncbi:MAG: DoxX family protein [Myxococcota bacterium]
MNNKLIGYWAVTGLFALALTGSGLGDLTRAAPIVEGLTHLGYPWYFPLILGFWKVLGVVGILAPGFPRVKEWAYAGFFFALTGAAASHLFAGDGLGGAVAPLVLLGLGIGSYALRPADRALPMARLATA